MAAFRLAPKFYLFTYPENSTSLWRQFLDEMQPAMPRHDELNVEVKNYKGRNANTTGDGLHAVFESPAGAIAAALAG